MDNPRLAKVKVKKPARKITKQKAKDNLTAEERGLDSSSDDKARGTHSTVAKKFKQSVRKDCLDGNAESGATQKMRKADKSDGKDENVDEEHTGTVNTVKQVTGKKRKADEAAGTHPSGNSGTDTGVHL
ncbi:uncharacterized protein MELLADRAFT_64460 [Melampsora larici-populina 98AG31]|uniref:Uncharacterized protein n=1 Tax=Melampsora larici-populina (strain 98AG31 / pathotype 3-4-7) TaxID=747676 RepID=F4RRI1_MELLP|nr:uncharacterized protein MELLADRAFT_64460 [Melampsora larici-populina 98AG31]EGG05026.1 hypothetical protein MELLADRAFT_64460 [Melampsora larici-populina 98AG31]